MPNYRLFLCKNINKKKTKINSWNSFKETVKEIVKQNGVLQNIQFDTTEYRSVEKKIGHSYSPYLKIDVIMPTSGIKTLSKYLARNQTTYTVIKILK
jgi:molybdopterin-binding protein